MPAGVGVTAAHGRLIEVDPLRQDTVAGAAAAAAEALAVGGLVIMPTETVYGIACTAGDPRATAQLFEAKRRPRELLLAVLVPSAASAWEVARPSPAAEALAAAFWPGPLTMVLPRTTRSLPWDLGHPQGDRPATVAVRVPDHPVALAVLERTGPLATTSANLTATPPLDDAADLLRTFGEAVSVCLVMTPQAPAASGYPSTVLDLAEGSVRVLRAGALHPSRVRAELERVLPGTQWVDFD